MIGPEAASAAGVEFSLSHSEALAAVAVVTGARVGIDVEVERPRARLDGLAARVLGPEAHADWLDVEPARQLRAFLEQWCAKEAYLKAVGSGITVPLRDVPPEPEGWTVAGFPTPPGRRRARRRGGWRIAARRALVAAGLRSAVRAPRLEPPDRQVPGNRGRLGVRGRIARVARRARTTAQGRGGDRAELLRRSAVHRADRAAPRSRAPRRLDRDGPALVTRDPSRTGPRSRLRPSRQRSTRIVARGTDRSAARSVRHRSWAMV